MPTSAGPTRKPGTAKANRLPGESGDITMERGQTQTDRGYVPARVNDPLAQLPEPLKKAARRVACPKEGWLFHQGDKARAIFFVVTGEVRLSRFGKDGKEVVLQRARRGEFFAEAALDIPHYHCDGIASEASSLIEVPTGAVRKLLDSDPRFSRRWVALLSNQLRRTRARLERLSLKGARERIRHYLLSEGQSPTCTVSIEGTFKDLARDLGLTHETLYRTLAKMERDGEIDRTEHSICLIQPPPVV
jgi:CRP-like cAMP-binding protein